MGSEGEGLSDGWKLPLLSPPPGLDTCEELRKVVGLLQEVAQSIIEGLPENQDPSRAAHHRRSRDRAGRSKLPPRIHKPSSNLDASRATFHQQGTRPPFERKWRCA